jgi:hypothetical protein
MGRESAGARTRNVGANGAAALALLGATLLGTAAFGATGLRAQEEGETPPRPSHVHTGDCDEPGPIVQPLNNLTAPGTDVIGNDEAVVAEAAFTNIPLSLEAMVAEDHSIKVHLSRERIETYLACGDIGGTLDQDGALIVGLKEQDGSGYTGIAYLRPLANGTTDTSVIIAEVIPRVAGPAAGGDQAAASTAEATAPADAAAPAAGEAEEVAVSLTEFAIEMPTELAAGPVRMVVTNDGAVAHNFVVEGEGFEERLPARLNPGQSATLEFDLPAGAYTAYCPVGAGAHRANGMEVALTAS